MLMAISQINGLIRTRTRIQTPSSFPIWKYGTNLVLQQSTVAVSKESISRIKVKKIDKSMVGTTIKIQGWVRTMRDQKKFAFVEVNDGSTLGGIQVVAQSEILTYNVVQELTTGSSVDIVGTVVVSQGKGQAYEILASEVVLIGECSNEYPLQKKRHSTEFLRSIAHLRCRTNTYSAISRVRSALAFATHNFFHNEGFVYLQSPLITTSDCEGAGEMFRVTTLPLENLSTIPKENSTNSADFSKDFFTKPAYLTVSGQLSGEIILLATFSYVSMYPVIYLNADIFPFSQARPMHAAWVIYTPSVQLFEQKTVRPLDI